MALKHNLKLFIIVLAAALTTLSFVGNVVAEANTSVDNLNAQINDLVNQNGPILGETMLVQYKEAQSQEAVVSDFENPTLFSAFGASTDPQIVLVKEDTALITYENSDDLESGLRKALLKPEVDFAQPIYKYTRFADYNPTSNPEFTNQWYLQNSAAGINLPTAFGNIGDELGVDCTLSARCGGETTTKIAVIDSGVNLDGTEIASDSVDVANGARFFYNGNNTCEPGEYFETLNLGTVSVPILINFCLRTGEFPDDDGHGTTVASSIIMEDNSSNGVGTAFNTTLLPVALNGDFSYNSFIVGEALTYAVDQGADVINLSMGTSSDDPFLKQAIDYAYNNGTTVVVSSGNCGNKTELTCGIGSDNTTLNPLIYPAEYDEVISVGGADYGATLSAINRTSYSSYSPSLDLVVGVGDGGVSPFGIHGLDDTGTYSTDNTGTSFTSPVVAGVVGLAYSIRPNITPDEVATALRSSAKDLNTPGFDNETGYGLLDAAAFIDNVIFNYPPYSATQIIGGSKGEPAQIEFDGKFFQAVRGRTNDDLFTRYSNDGINWNAWIPSGRTGEEISMIVFNNRLYQAIRGTNDGIYTRSTSDGINWSVWGYSGRTIDKITMTVYNSRLYQSLRGFSDGIYTRYTADGVNWTPWVYSGRTKSEVSMEVFNSRLYQSIRGGDDGIYVRYTTDGDSWTPWTPNGRTIDEITLQTFNSRLYQSVRGGNNGIYTRYTIDGDTWTNWAYSGLTSTEITLHVFDNKLFQAIRGTNDGIHTRFTSDGDTWTGWTMNEYTLLPIYFHNHSDGQLYQFTTQVDNNLYSRRTTDGITWTDWNILSPGITTSSQLSAGSRQIALVTGTSNNTYQTTLD